MNRDNTMENARNDLSGAFQDIEIKSYLMLAKLMSITYETVMQESQTTFLYIAFNENEDLAWKLDVLHDRICLCHLRPKPIRSV